MVHPFFLAGLGAVTAATSPGPGLTRFFSLEYLSSVLCFDHACLSHSEIHCGWLYGRIQLLCSLFQCYMNPSLLPTLSLSQAVVTLLELERN